MEPTPDLHIAAVAAQQHGVFSATQAAEVGLSRDAMSRRVQTGRWGRLYRGVFRIAGSPPTWDQRVTAAWLAVGGDAALSYTVAARLVGLPLVGTAIELTVPAPGRHRIAGLVVHRTSMWTPADRAIVGPLVTTSATRTLLDLSAELRKEKLAACVDNAVTRRLTSVAYLRRRIETMGYRGRPHLRAFDELLSSRYPHERAPESPLERGLIDILLELPGEPIVPQHWVQLPNGEWVRLDGAWPPELVAVEGDSYRHHSSPDDWALDQTKRTVLTAMGWRILTFTDFDIKHRPRWILEQAAAARKLRLAS